MRQRYYLLPFFVLICLPLAVFSQQAESKTEQSKAGLKKIGGGRSPKVDVHIDQAKLEADIESAVETALKSVEHSLEGLHINIEPIEISLGSLEALDALEPLMINIPNLDIDIEPIEAELDDLDIDVDDNDWNDEGDEDEDDDQDVDKIITKDKLNEEIKAGKDKLAKEKANKLKEKSNKERAKGLNKVD
jgi:hypothetical protein